MKKFCTILIILLGFIISPRNASCQNTGKTISELQYALKSTKTDTGRVKLLNELSGEFIIASQYDSAFKYSNEALALAEELNYEPGIASAYRKLGSNYTNQGNYSAALQHLFKSLQINERLGNQQEIFKLYNNIGNAYSSQRDYSSALSYFKRAYIQNKIDGATTANLGITYIYTAKWDSAKWFSEEALKNYSIEKNRMGESDMINNMGYIYECQGKDTIALEYYFQALKIKEEIDDKPGICDVLSGIGDIYFLRKDFKAALLYEQKSLALAYGISYLFSAQQTEAVISSIYDSLRNKIKSFEHYKKHILLRDSIYNEQQTKDIVRTEMNFEFDKKEAIAQAVHEGEIKNQRTQRNAFVVLFVLVAVFSVVVFRGYKKTRKQKLLIESQKVILENQQKDITDSINYAQKIQAALLPSQEYINKLFPENFITYLPRNIVSGDYYWAYTDGESKYISTIDNSGHSIPGCLTGSVTMSLLNEIVLERKITAPNQVLDTLRTEIIKSLNKEGNDERKDGCDLVFLKITDLKLECACANNPIYIIRGGELIEIKQDRFPCSKYVVETPFTLQTFDLQKGDAIFTFSDGFADQFGEETGKKLMAKRFKSWLIELAGLEMSDIKSELESRFNKWRGKEEQVDDVVVFSIRI